MDYTEERSCESQDGELGLKEKTLWVSSKEGSVLGCDPRHLIFNYHPCLFRMSLQPCLSVLS